MLGIHLSRDALQADHRGGSLGAPAACRLLTGIGALEAGEDAGAPRVGLSRLELVAKMLIDYPSWKSAFNCNGFVRCGMGFAFAMMATKLNRI
jgi:hypothetical protein